MKNKDGNALWNDPRVQEITNTLIQRALNGDVEAMYSLGTTYYEGKYVKYNLDTACYWWTEAAKKGNVDCQLNLGYLYHGDVSPLYYNEHLAGHWFYMASTNGSKEAYEMLRNHYKLGTFSKKWKRTD